MKLLIDKPEPEPTSDKVTIKIEIESDNAEAIKAALKGIKITVE